MGFFLNLLVSFGAGFAYGSIFLKSYKKRLSILVRLGIIYLLTLLLQLELSQLIMSLITFITGMWIAIALSIYLDHGHKNI